MTDFTGGAWRSLVDGSNVFAIPDEQITRPDDNNTGNNNRTQGLKIELKTDWPSIGATISNNTSGVTRAYLWDSDQNEIDSVDISSLSSGDSFAFEDVGLTEGNKYYIVLDAEGDNHDTGYYSASDPFPYEGDNLDIIARWSDSQDQFYDPIAINNVGNTGL